MTSLQVTNFDLQRKTNASAHKTIDYITNEVVLRRGQPWTMALTFNRQVQPAESLKIIVETGPSPSVQTNTKAEIPVTTSSSGTSSWSAVRRQSSTNTWNITMNIPVSAVIGRYRMSLQATSGGRSTVSGLGGFIALFNPWASGDEVYMSNEAEKNEYVLNQTGLYWAGNVNSYGSRQWDYGQFEKDILDIILILLDKSLEYRRDPAIDVSRRNDPAYIGRVLSAMVNSNNDNGVIIGRWSGDYSDGVMPTTWNGSAPILRQWRQSGPVRYGQCWVYAGVLCTVLRCLGIPARLIINFQSAHDTDNNLLVDYYYDESGKRDNYRTSDSVWNFHAWDEIYCVRIDLDPFYNGWQVLDATPQELSDGVYRLGPTPLKAVKEGDVDVPYDTSFVYSEVNADQVHWIRYKDGKIERVYSEPIGVGQLTSTKAVGSFERKDVTDDYKYREGSSKEREVFLKAKKKMETPRLGMMSLRESAVSAPVKDVPPAKPQFSGSFKKPAETHVGKDLKLTLVLKNDVNKPQKIKINMTASSIIYNSTVVKDILTNSQSVTLGPNEEKNIQLLIPYAKYRLALTPDNMIQVGAVCVDENRGNMLIQTVTTLKNPALLMRAIEDVKYNKVAKVDVIFTNPIQEDVPNSVLIVEGSGLLEEQIIIKVPGIKANQRVTVQFEMTPYREGERSLLADFSSTMFPCVKAFERIPVAS